MSDTLLIATIGFGSTLLGIALSGYVSYRSARSLFLFQKKSESQIRSYSRLMGLKLPLIQVIQTNLEAKMLCEFYDVRFIRLTHDSNDREEAKRQNERHLALIPQISELLQEIFETLGEVLVAFKVDPELEKRIDALYHFTAADIQFKDSSGIKTEKDLEQWKESVNGKIHEYLKAEFKDKFEALLPLLRNKVKL